MKKLIVALTLALSAAVAQADIVITSGAKGGTYHGVYGANMASIFRETASGAKLLTSKGSVENIERVASGEAHIGFTQADAFMRWASLNADAANNITIMGTLAQECIYVAVAEDGKIGSEDDIGKGVKLAAQKKGSGAAETWAYQQQLEPDYSKAQTYYKGGVMALGQVAAGQLDAVLWVTDPNNLDHKYLKLVNTKGSGLKLIDWDDWDVNDKLPTGESVYEFKEVETSRGWFADSINTACTSVLTIINNSISEEAQEELATILAFNKDRIVTR